MKKKLLSVMLAVALSAGCMTPLMVSAGEGERTEALENQQVQEKNLVSEGNGAARIIEQGSCGETATYTLDSEGNLTISGSGEIYYRAFANWTDIKSVEILVGITGISESAFIECDNLNSIFIPEGITKIRENAFEGCSELESITVAAGNTKYDNRNDCNAIIETDTNKLIVGCKNTTIPTSVTCIGNSAFYRCNSLNSIDIPEGVLSIGNFAFKGCSNLKMIHIPMNVVSMGQQVFEGCDSLESITVDSANTVYDSRNDCNAIVETGTDKILAGCKNTIIPSSITTIEDFAFSGCNKINIPAGVTSIGSCAFAKCHSLESITVESDNTVYDSRNNCNAIIETYTNKLITGCKNTTIPSGVKSIGNAAFYERNGLSSISIPEGVLSIGDSAFYGCTGLSSINMPKGLTSMGKNAFSGCTGLSNINMPEELISIGNHAFHGCRSLISIIIPKKVTSIDWGVFEGCSKLTSISIPEDLTSIGIRAFGNCSNLTSIIIPKGVTDIVNDAFSGCTNLETIIIDADNTVYDSRNSCNAIIETSTNTLITGCKNTSIPASVTTIGNQAFYGCSNLNGIDIPKGVTTIGGGAFGLCSNLHSINISESVTNIGNEVFFNCSSLSNIIIPTNVTSIGEDAFKGCDNLIISCYKDSLAHKYALGNGIPYKLLDEQQKPDPQPIPQPVPQPTPQPTPETKQDSDNNSNTVKKGSVVTTSDAAYKVTGKSEVTLNSIKRKNSKKISVPDKITVNGKSYKVTSVAPRAFKGCKAKTIIFGNNIKTIGASSVENCKNLTSVTIGKNITEIGKNAFKANKNLKTITIKSTKLKKVGKDAFKGINTKAKIKVPKKKYSAYKKLLKGKGQGKKVTIVKAK